MQTTFRCTDIANVGAQSADTLVIMGRKGRMRHQSILDLLPAAAQDVWLRMIASLSPGDAGDATSGWIPDSTAEHGARRLTAVVLPDACSRYNSRAHPYPLRAMGKQHIGKDGRTAVVVMLEHADDLVASMCAVARSLPAFSRKTRNSAGDTGNKEKKDRHVSMACLAAEGTITASALAQAASTAAAVRRAAEWVDTPTSELNTDALVEAALAVAQRVDAKATVISGEELRTQGFGGLWNVGRAAMHGPALVVLRYEPKAGAGGAASGWSALKNVVWIGKGIVYDTGGLSLKGSDTMPGMKGDLGGAAAVLAAFEAAAQQQFPHRLVAVLCIAENAIGPEATRPDDIITLYSGKTVEVNNTDAEGRLVLGDGIAYAVAHLQPDVIVDVATLTGAQAVTTGKRHAAIVSNDEGLEQAAAKAGRLSGDLVHPILYVPEFFRSEFKSDVADMKNAVKDRANAQSACAAQFIADHMGNYSGPWLHVDIAAPATIEERGTGFGVALLLTLFSQSGFEF